MKSLRDTSPAPSGGTLPKGEGINDKECNMARKKQEPEKKKKVNTDGIMGLVGSTTEQGISETLEVNYMPYAMSVIISRE